MNFFFAETQSYQDGRVWNIEQIVRQFMKYFRKSQMTSLENRKTETVAQFIDTLYDSKMAVQRQPMRSEQGSRQKEARERLHFSKLRVLRQFFFGNGFSQMCKDKLLVKVKELVKELSIFLER